MITKTNAVKMSVRKWERVVEKLEAGKTWNVAVGGACGFCVFFGEGYSHPECNLCPLYRSADGTKINKCYRLRCSTLFWDIAGHLRSGNFPQALELSREMLEVIKTVGAEWIKTKK